ncbi:hypothetical protein [Prauserella shujinwangii]|nr:hypothetical protein [Prauserella shujinwangii]
MTSTGDRRRLAFCPAHDRQHRWIRHPGQEVWWYLPPPLRNEPGRCWWALHREPHGFVGGLPGWYLHEHGGTRVVDTYSTTLYRARAIAEAVLGTLLAAG